MGTRLRATKDAMHDKVDEHQHGVSQFLGFLNRLSRPLYLSGCCILPGAVQSLSPASYPWAFVLRVYQPISDHEPLLRLMMLRIGSACLDDHSTCTNLPH